MKAQLPISHPVRVSHRSWHRKDGPQTVFPGPGPFLSAQNRPFSFSYHINHHGSRTFFLLPFVPNKPPRPNPLHKPAESPTVTQRPRERPEEPRALRRCRRTSCGWSWTSCGGWRASPSTPASRPSSPTRSATLKQRLRLFFFSSIFRPLSPHFLFSPSISFGTWVDSDPFLPIVSFRRLIAVAMAVGEGNRTVAGATGGGFCARARGASCFKLRHVGVVQLGPGQREDQGTLLPIFISFVPSIGRYNPALHFYQSSSLLGH